MTDTTINSATGATPKGASMKGGAELVAKRYAAERRFKSYGVIALLVTALFLLFLVVDIVGKGWPAFFEHTAKVEVMIDPASVDAKAIEKADFQALIRDAMRANFPGVTDRTGRKQLSGLLSSGAGDALREMVIADPRLIGTKVTVPALMSGDSDLYLKGYQADLIKTSGSSDLTIAEDGEGYSLATTMPLEPGAVVRADGGALKIVSIENGAAKTEVIEKPQSAGVVVAGKWDTVSFSTTEADRRSSDREILWLESMKDQGLVTKGFATRFFTSGDSRSPEMAGIRGALVGSLLVIAVTLSICLPIGVAAAVYLEEFAPKGRLTDLIEVNINNLAAVPSIIFGLLGLAIFLNFFGMPRSAPLVGGLVLALLVLPTIIIAARAAFRSVPPSIKEAALGVGASHQQAVFHHVLPLAVPGILTGTILGIARAFGESAPLLMIGMIAFIVDVPKGFTDAATVMPVQIFLWSDLPEIGFQSKTAAAIMVLLVVLFCLNAVAIYMRKRFERRW
jgi:phosphate transport system permease protein